MKYKLGFSKHPDKSTHFKFEPLYNKHMITESKRVISRDQVFLNLIESGIAYHLVFNDEQFLFKADQKQDLTVTKLPTPLGCEENRVQQQCKYVYIRNGAGNDFLVPVFDNDFTEYKMEHVSLKKLHETTGLRWQLVWKCVIHPGNKVTFVHCKTGVILSFDGRENISGSELRSSDSEEQLKKIRDGNYAVEIFPIKYGESVANTLIKEADFRIQQNQNYVKSYQAKYDAEVDGKKLNEVTYIDPPLLRNQEYFIDAFKAGNVATQNTRFKADAGNNVHSAAIFSIVKLEDVWKQEIEFSQSLSAMATTFFNLKVKDKFDNVEIKERRKVLNWEENIKLFYVLHDYLINEPEGELRPSFVSGKVVRLRNHLLFHKTLMNTVLLYLLMFYKWKKEEDNEKKKEEEANKDKKEVSYEESTVERQLNLLKILLFKIYRFLMQGQRVPIIYKEYIMRYYPGGDDFESYLEFIRGVFIELDHPYRTNDLNFRFRMIAHDKQIWNICINILQQNLKGNHLKDPHDSFKLINLFSNPNGVPYRLNQWLFTNHISNHINDGYRHMYRYRFLYKDGKIIVQKLDKEPKVEVGIEEINTFTQEEQLHLIGYMKFIANMAIFNEMSRLKGCFSDPDLPLIDVVTNPKVDFRLSGEFLNTILESFIDILKARIMTSNSYHTVFEYETSVNDKFWEADQPVIKDQVKVLYPIMLNKAQDVESLFTNISFELQRLRFFSSMIKYNMLFELEYDPDEWLQKVFDHCNKMILLVLTQYAEEGHSKRKNKDYEVTENYPQDYTSQKSVFELHFWYAKTAKHQSNQAMSGAVTEASYSENGESKIRIDQETINNIISETLTIFHYLAEIRHKYLSACINEKVHDKVWSPNFKNKGNDFIGVEAAYEQSQEIGKIVLDSVTNKRPSLKNSTYIPTLNELYANYLNNIASDPAAQI